MKDKIKKDLPNFPDEVIDIWLTPYIEELNWPPSNRRWEGILFEFDISFWKSVKWQKKEINLMDICLDHRTIEIINKMTEAYIKHEDTFFKREMSKSRGEDRYLSALKFIASNRKFPKPIIILEIDKSYAVVDGNHRLFALQQWFNICKIIDKLEKGSPKYTNKLEGFLKTLSSKWNINEVIKPNQKQGVWIAT